jgi:protease YdgD
MKVFSALNVFWMLTGATASAGQYTPDFTGARRPNGPDFISAVRTAAPVAAASGPEAVMPITYLGTEAYNPTPGRDASPEPGGAMDKNVFTGNNRGKVTSTEFPWRAIGRLNVTKGHCTASLVAKDLIITNAHCVLDKSSGTITDWNITFLPNYIDGKSAYSSGIARAWWSNTDDWALLRLEKPLGDTLGWLGIRILADPRNETLFAVSYSEDLYSGLSASWQKGCTITSGPTSYGQLRHNCSNSRGSSGSPLFRFEEKDGQKSPRIIAIHAAELRYDGDSTYTGVEYSDNKANLAVPAEKFLNAINENDKAAPAAAAKAAPGSR